MSILVGDYTFETLDKGIASTDESVSITEYTPGVPAVPARLTLSDETKWLGADGVWSKEQPVEEPAVEVQAADEQAANEQPVEEVGGRRSRRQGGSKKKKSKGGSKKQKQKKRKGSKKRR